MRTFFFSSFLMVAAAQILCGCSSLSAGHVPPDRALIEAQYSRIEPGHGASREDAIIIAQHYMLAKGYDYDWFVAAPQKVSDDPEHNSWTVAFEPKEDGYGSGPRHGSEITFQMLLPFWVTVHKDTGEISVVVVRAKTK